MRRFLRWLLFGDMHPLDADLRAELIRRVDVLEDDIEHLGRRFTRLQGQVTRSWREEAEDEDPELDEFSELVEERKRGGLRG